MESIGDDITIIYQEKFDRILDQNEEKIEFLTKNGEQIETKWIVNTAGYDSLRISKQFGIGNDYNMLPLRGFYLKAKFEDLENFGY